MTAVVVVEDLGVVKVDAPLLFFFSSSTSSSSSPSFSFLFSPLTVLAGGSSLRSKVFFSHISPFFSHHFVFQMALVAYRTFAIARYPSFGQRILIINLTEYTGNFLFHSPLCAL